MKRYAITLISAAVLLFTVARSVAGQATGEVRGTVKTLSGNPVMGATVSAHPFHRAGNTSRWEAGTDQEGNFLIRGLPPGPYTLSAVKEADYFADTRFTFYDSKYPPPEVVVNAGQVTRNVLITVGPQAARVVGWIIDAATQERVRGAGITFYMADSPQPHLVVGVGVLGEFNRLVGSNTPFRMKVSAPGFRTWYYGPDNTEEHAAMIRMKPGETKKLIIRLKPLKQGH